MISILRAGDRFETVQPGITTRHCFSSGAHYDPSNTGFGALIGCDEHVVAPGAGFSRHTHRGVEILSWVLDGTLRHEDRSGRVETIDAGAMQFQAAGSGIEHSELNASDAESLRFVQMTLLADVDEPRYLRSDPPLVTSAGEFMVHYDGTLRTDAPRAHLFVAHGSFEVAGERLFDGDSVRSDGPVTVDGSGELLVWAFTC